MTSRTYNKKYSTLINMIFSIASDKNTCMKGCHCHRYETTHINEENTSKRKLQTLKTHLDFSIILIIFNNDVSYL